MTDSIRHSRHSRHPLSSPQREIWFDQMLHPDAPLYNIGGYIEIDGPVDAALFERAAGLVVLRHDALRTILEPGREDAPMQTFPADVAVDVPFVDFSGEKDPRRSALERMERRFVEPFEMMGGPLFRFELLRVSDDLSFFWFVYHHLIIDGWGISIANRTLAEIYTALARGEEPDRTAPSYLDFIENDREYIGSKRFEKNLQYWMEKYGTLPEPLCPPRYPNRSGLPHPSARRVLWLPRPFYDRLTAFARETRTTMFHLMLGALYVYFTRAARRDDLAVGLPILNRVGAAFKETVGLFIGVSPAWFQFGAELSFKELLTDIGKSLRRGYRHQRLPISELNRAAAVRKTGREQLFDIRMNYARHDHDNRFGAAGSKTIALTNGHEPTPLIISVWEFHEHEDVQVDFVYNQACFSPEEIQGVQSRFKGILEYALDHADASIHEFPLMTEEDARRLRLWNRTEAHFPKNETIVDLFREQVEKTPENIAVVCGDRSLAYRDLNARANRLAHYLMTLGVGAETLVGVCVERSLEMVIGLLGVLKAGGAYAPLDPEYPEERLRFMLEDSRASVLLSQGSLLERLPASKAIVVDLENDWEAISAHPGENPPVKSDPGSPAYVIFTSGSTGRPKGVLVEHAAIYNHMQWMLETFDFGVEDRVLQKTPFSFDASVWEFYAPLLSGGALVMAEPGRHMEPEYLIETIRRRNITILQLVPSLLKMMLETDEFQKETPLRYLFCGGEKLTDELRRDFYAAPRGYPLYNLYGPAEATIDAAFHPCEHGEAPAAIGRPIANTRVYILDDHLRPTPPGVPGELCIAGAGLARGYLHRPELTREKFIEIELFGRWERIYKTGDSARWLPDGALEYIGRLDHQIKLRGFRIELGEIEAALKRHETVRETAVVYTEKGRDPRLDAYVALTAPADDAAPVLRAWLRGRLPDYMIPTSITVLSHLPLTPSGKIDRRGLPEPTPEAGADYTRPRTEIERKIARVWRRVLERRHVGVHENFFDLGGHSLSMIRVHKRLRTELKKPLTMVELFQFPTVAALADHVTGGVEKTAPRAGAPGMAEGEEIAIIGMAGRFPGAGNVEAFWRNIRDGVESITFFSYEELLAEGVSPDLLNHPDYVKARGVLENIESFDAAFFGYTPREAEIMDPQHRLFLECAVEAMENAGWDADRFDGRVGVYAGSGANTYLSRNIASRPEIRETVGEYHLMLANAPDHLAARASYKLGLNGPSVAVQTACSTSLTAVHIACRSLLGNECDMALAGGVGVGAPGKTGHLYQPDMIASPDGHCRAFDANARGTVGGSGLGVVALKRLERARADRDHIHAVIKGSAITNDGRGKVGYTAPGLDGQASVIAAAMGDLDYESVRCVEAHGTGTPMGDPVEIAALTRAYRAHTREKGYCAIGSVKTNIGHLDAAAGIAGLIKTVMALKHEQLPPSLHFERPNPEIDFADSPFYVNTECTPWRRTDGAPRRAGVSSFGMGGANVHVVLEEAPGEERRPPESTPAWHLLPLSARTSTALEKATVDLAEHLERNPGIDLGDVAYTLASGRKAFEHRRMLVCRTAVEAVKALGAGRPDPVPTQRPDHHARPPVFMFSGREPINVDATMALYRHEPVFREGIDRCAAILKTDLDIYLLDTLHPRTGQTAESSRLPAWGEKAHLALFAAEYALARLWMAWGVRPAAFIGRGVGEHAAACLDGALSLEEAVLSAAEETDESAAASRDERFDERLRELLAEPEAVFLEIGPGRILTTLVNRHPDKTGRQTAFHSLDHPDDPSRAIPALLTTLGNLWLDGVSIDWSGFYAGKQRRRLPLPTYPFERRRYWVEPRKAGDPAPPPTPGKQPDIADWFYLPAWKSTEPAAFRTAPAPPSPGCWLVFLDRCGLGDRLAEKLAQSGRDVVLVRTGDEFIRISDGEYALNPGKGEDYQALVRLLRTAGKRPRSIVHLWSVTPDHDTALEDEMVRNERTMGYYSLLHLARALADPTVSDACRLMVVSNHIHAVTGDEELRPEKAAALGPVRVIGQEHPNIVCRNIDVVLPSSAEMDAKLVDLLAAELTTPSADPVAAYRGRHRWTPSYEPVPLEKSVNGTPPPGLKKGGVCLITGGLGQIGLAMAEHLAATMRARLVLTGRSFFPARDQWSEWLAAHDELDAVSRKIETLRMMEERGAEVWTARADVASLRQMRDVITGAEERFGPIDAVIHAAGVIGEDAFHAFEYTNKSSSERQFRAKIDGVLVLEKVFRTRKPRFCLLMSSLSSVLGGLGYVAYAAANAFMDAFTHRHNQNDDPPWLCVNWDGWRFENGAEPDGGVGRAMAELAMTPEEGVEVFGRMLSIGRVDRLIVSTGSLQERIGQWTKTEAGSMEDDVEPESALARYTRPDLPNPHAAPRDELERTLVEIWQTLLGVEPVGIHDDFFELGGDSILGGRVTARVSKERRVGLPMHVLFENPTIAGIAAYISEAGAAGRKSSGETGSGYTEGEI